MRPGDPGVLLHDSHPQVVYRRHILQWLDRQHNRHEARARILEGHQAVTRQGDGAEVAGLGIGKDLHLLALKIVPEDVRHSRVVG